MIRDVKLTFPRIDGQGYKFPKLHLMKHLPDDIDNFGSPLNFDCNTAEHSLQSFAKNLSKTVSKTTSLDRFYDGLAERLYFKTSIDKVLSSCQHGQFMSELASMYTLSENSSRQNKSIIYRKDEKIKQQSQKNIICQQQPNWVATYKVVFMQDETDKILSVHKENLYTLKETSFSITSNSKFTLSELCKNEIKKI